MDDLVGLPVLCLECDKVHPFPNHHCLSCGHAVCERCIGCSCAYELCDCAYADQMSRE